MSTYARVNDLGFLETPYIRVKKGQVQPDEVDYLTAHEEEHYTIAQANAPLDKNGYFVRPEVMSRKAGDFVLATAKDVEYIDVSPKQVVSIAAGLIPFLEHDDANRALMGSNMQRQAVPLLVTEQPLVGTGLEGVVARESGAVILAAFDGIVKKSDASMIVIENNETGDIQEVRLQKFERSNAGITINQ